MKGWLISAALLANLAFGRISPHVSSSSPVYDYLNRLEAFGCVKTTNRILRPLAYADLQMAGKDPDGSACHAPEWLKQELHLLTRPSLQMDFRLAAGLFEQDELQLSGQDARLRTLFPELEGRGVFDGSNLYAEATLHSGSGEVYGFSASVTPGFLWGLENYQHFNGRFYLQEAYVKAGYQRAELLWGRVAKRFGDIRHDGVILTSSAKPLDLLQLEIRPHQIGTPFSFLGPTGLKAWLAFDGDSLPTNRYFGFEFSTRPLTFLELAFLEMFQFSEYEDLKGRRNERSAVYLGLWGPDNYFKIYSQFFFQKIGFQRDISTASGLWFPKLGEWEARFEYTQTVPNSYSHNHWTQGWTFEGTPLGSPLGENGTGLYFDVGLPAMDGWRPELGFAYEKRVFGVVEDARNTVMAGVVKRWVYVEAGAKTRYQWADSLSRFGIFADWKYSFF